MRPGPSQAMRVTPDVTPGPIDPRLPAKNNAFLVVQHHQPGRDDESGSRTRARHCRRAAALAACGCSHAGRGRRDATQGVRRRDERARDAGGLRARRNGRPAAVGARGCQGLAARRNGELEARCPGHRHRRGGMSLKIGILLGDDIGLEVVPECIKVMKAAAARERLDIDWRALPIGKHGHEQHGNTLPAVTEQTLRELDGWVMGPIGHAAYPRGDATWVMPPVRKKFDLFAAVRPSLSHSNLPSIHKDVDIVFFREITEGMLYSETVVAGSPEFRPNDDITVAMRVITRKGSNRVGREAFEIARTRERKKVTAAHKEPVYRLACGMFAEECRKVAREYPDVTFEEMMIDSISMKLVTAPQQFDVVVTTNQFGDILT